MNQNETELGKVLKELRTPNYFGGAEGWSDSEVNDLLSDYADQICEALKEPNTVFEILKQFHDAHYSVFPRDELTERLCHAFYDQFVEKPKTEGV